MQEINNCVQERKKATKASICQALSSSSFTKPMAILSAIFFLLGLCGNDTMLFYGPTIFSDVDIGLPYSLVITLPWVGVSLGYALSGPLMTRMNRVAQFVTFSSIMAVGMVVLASMMFLMNLGWTSAWVQASLIASLLISTTAYGMGVGAVPYTIIGEIFTPEFRTLGSCMAQVVR